jgi:hypothetical protein
MEITYDETITKVYNDYTYDEEDFNKGEDFNEENDEDNSEQTLCKIKIGSIVFFNNIGWVKITNIFWDALSKEFCFSGLGLLNNCKYDMIRDCDLNSEMVFDNTEELFLLKNTNMDKQLELQIKGHETNDSWAKWDLPDGYEFQDKDGNVINTNIIKLVKKQPKYPTTYKECCKVLGISRHDVEIDLPHPYQQNMFNLFKLLICRDAYWKIAGEEMGLDKSWEPDWNNIEQDKFVIFTNNNSICANKFKLGHNILAFPTKEMRDLFYEKFKDLIEKCKELL